MAQPQQPLALTQPTDDERQARAAAEEKAARDAAEAATATAA
jgi:hypothetical protein